MKTKRPAAPTRHVEQNSLIGVIASQIRQAAEFLVEEHGYTLKNLENLTGGGDREGKGVRRPERLHKNSVMKIKDLRIGWASQHRQSDGKRRWIGGPMRAKSDDGSPSRRQWLWNPQIDTFEKLELILVEARRLGFEPKPVRSNDEAAIKAHAA